VCVSVSFMFEASACMPVVRRACSLRRYVHQNLMLQQHSKKFDLLGSEAKSTRTPAGDLANNATRMKNHSGGMALQSQITYRTKPKPGHDSYSKHDRVRNEAITNKNTPSEDG